MGKSLFGRRKRHSGLRNAPGRSRGGKLPLAEQNVLNPRFHLGRLEIYRGKSEHCTARGYGAWCFGHSVGKGGRPERHWLGVVFRGLIETIQPVNGLKTIPRTNRQGTVVEAVPI